MSNQIGGTHYSQMEIEPWVYAERNKLSFLEGTIIKYVSRHRAKGKKEDLQKAMHCLQLLTKELYG